jgi:preprotein translocase subunit SecE
MAKEQATATKEARPAAKPAKPAKPAAKPAKPKKENRIVRYFKQTRAELRKVTWPSREEAIRLTAIVLGMTIVMAAFLGLVDYIFARLFALFL